MKMPETPAVLAVLALAVYAATVFILLFHPIPADNKEVVAGAVGFIGGTLVGGAFAFYFGSSKGSQGKDETIAAMIAGQTAAPAPAAPPPAAGEGEGVQ